MGKAKKDKARSSRKPMDPQARRRRRRAAIVVIVAAIVLVGAALGVNYTRQWVEQQVASSPEPPMVVLVNRPAWMSDSLAEQIIQCARPSHGASAFDHKLLEEAAARLRQNPWVREVRQVRRVYGRKPGDTLEIDCEYRAPVALVYRNEVFHLVDGEGYVLPEQYVVEQVPRIVLGPDRQMNLRVVDGVQHEPPPPGRQWPGADLQAALDLAKLLYGRDYADEIYRINVSNFDGRRDRREAQIVLVTKRGTEVRWGQAVNDPAFFNEIPVAQKLERLQQLHAEYGRVDARRPWVDIRIDKIRYPLPDAQSAQANGR